MKTEQFIKVSSEGIFQISSISFENKKYILRSYDFVVNNNCSSEQSFADKKSAIKSLKGYYKLNEI